MATTYELSYFQTDTGLSGTSFVYGFDALTSADVRVIGYSGAGGVTKTDLTSTIATVNTTTKTLTFTTAPSAYSKIRIYRSTTVLPLIEFTSGAVLSEDALNTAYRHSLFAAQEVSQDASDSSNRSVIFTADINNGAVTADKLAIDSVTATKIADNAILDEHINTGAVTNTKLANASVGATKLASDSVTTVKILDANVTAAKLASTLDLSSKTLTLPDINQPFSKQLFYMVEELATNTAGGSSVALTQNIRAINTVVENGITGASLNAGTYQVTLPAGKYLFDYSCPAYKTNAHVALIYQVSPATAGIIGNGNNSYSHSTDGTVTNSSGSSIITLTASSTVIELRHYTVTAQATNGLGLQVNLAGRSERYSFLKIWKIA
jgi:hypothetical protein